MLQISEEQITKDWKSKDYDNPKVSIRCFAYNQEKYIAECLEGFLMQKTNFPFRIVVHDDASTDKTADIIREYEEKYPHIIAAVYETENQYSKKDGSLGRSVKHLCDTPYIALCEGDDFWIDPDKLQLQYDALESNPDCSLCTCHVVCCDEKGDRIDREFPDDSYGLRGKDCVINADEFAKMLFLPDKGYPFHTSSYFFRRETFNLDIPGVTKYFKRDRGAMFRALLSGNVYYYDRPMSTRRYGANGSWNQMLNKSGDIGRMNVFSEDYKAEVILDMHTNARYRNLIFPRNLNRLVWIMKVDRSRAVELARYTRGMMGSDDYVRCKGKYVRRLPASDRFLVAVYKDYPVIFYIFLFVRKVGSWIKRFVKRLFRLEKK